jgi:hypothetical protein
MKIKKKKFKTVDINSPLRAEHVFKCMRKEICPDCGHRIGETFEVDGIPVEEDEIGVGCFKCEWRAVFGVPEWT